MLRQLLTLSLTVFGSAALAQSVQLQPATFSDLQPNQLVSSRTALPSVNNSQDSVEFSWPVTSTALLGAQEQPHVQQSRQYWLDASGTQLAAGVEISTTAPGAIVRISPLEPDSKSAAFSQQDITLSIQGNRLNTGEGIEHLADQQSLNAAGASFSEGTVAFRLSESLGAGSISVQAANAAAVSDQFVVHVFEPNSPAVLNLQADRGNYLAGHSLNATLSLQGIAHQLSAGDIQGYLSSPDVSVSLPVSFTANRNGGFDASVQLPQSAGNGHGLWSLHAFINTRDANGLTVIRDAKTALAVAAPTARLNGQASMTTAQSGSGSKGIAATNNSGMQFTLGMDVAVAGRYEISGVLYGTAKNGQLQPLAVSQSAAWLNAGQGQLNLSFDPDLLAASGLSAPFAVRDLRLKDQSRLSLLETRQQGLGVTL